MHFATWSLLACCCQPAGTGALTVSLRLEETTCAVLSPFPHSFRELFAVVDYLLVLHNLLQYMLWPPLSIDFCCLGGFFSSLVATCNPVIPRHREMFSAYV